MNLRSLWVSPVPVSEKPRRGVGEGESRYTFILWVVALIILINIVAFRDGRVNDFAPIHHAVSGYWNYERIYSQNYTSTAPLYLWSPGATILLSPFGLMEFGTARRVFVLAGAVALIWAFISLSKLAGFNPVGPLPPAALIAACATETVTNTLIFGNINTVLLLLLTGFIYFLTYDRPWPAGFCIAFAILIKPQFAPLLILPLIKAQWQVLVPVGGVTALFNVWGFIAVSHAWEDYTGKLIPYLAQTRPFANVSIPGLAASRGSDVMNFPWLLLWTGMFAVGTVTCVLLLRYRYTDPFFWLTSTTAVGLVCVFLLSSLGQTYYSMWIFPFLFATVAAPSIWRNVGFVVSLILFLTTLSWNQPWVPDILIYYRATWGWILFVVAILYWLVGKLVVERKSSDPLHGVAVAQLS